LQIETDDQRLARLMTNDPNVDAEEMMNLLSGSHRWKKQPLDYISSKYKMLDNLMPIIPYRNLFVESCVGCSPVFLNRKRSKLEVINDKYTGITNYYRVIRSPAGRDRLMKMIEESILSIEMFDYFMDKLRECDKRPFPHTLEGVEEQDIYYAFYWFYTLANSLFSRQEVCRMTNRREMEGFAKEMWDALPKFDTLHKRLQNVVVWNSGVVECMEYWDRADSVFYIDPPYRGTAQCFKHNFTEQDHIDLLTQTLKMEAWVGISQYQNDLYDTYLPNKITFNHKQSNGFGQDEKIECLYIHEGV
jgi:DNA adenine methylase